MPETDHDAPVPRARQRSHDLASALIDKLDTVLHVGIPQAAKDMLAIEASRMVESAWASMREDEPARTRTDMRVKTEPTPQPRQSRAWPVIAAVLVVIMLAGAIASVWLVVNLQLENMSLTVATLRSEQSTTRGEIDKLRANLADDAAYNRVVANWLVLHVETTNENARRNDQIQRAVAAKIGADVSAIEPPIRESLPTEVNRMHYQFLDQSLDGKK